MLWTKGWNLICYHTTRQTAASLCVYILWLGSSFLHHVLWSRARGTCFFYSTSTETWPNLKINKSGNLIRCTIVNLILKLQSMHNQIFKVHLTCKNSTQGFFVMLPTLQSVPLKKEKEKGWFTQVAAKKSVQLTSGCTAIFVLQEDEFNRASSSQASGAKMQQSLSVFIRLCHCLERLLHKRWNHSCLI